MLVLFEIKGKTFKQKLKNSISCAWKRYQYWIDDLDIISWEELQMYIDRWLEMEEA